MKPPESVQPTVPSAHIGDWHAQAPRAQTHYGQAAQTSSDSFFSSSSSSSSSSFESGFLVSSSAFFASSSSFFMAFSTSLNSFHFFAKLSASTLSSVMMMLSKMVLPFTCHRSKPMKLKSANL